MQHLVFGTGYYVVLFCELMKKEYSKKEEKVERVLFFIFRNFLFLMGQIKKQNVSLLM